MFDSVTMGIRSMDWQSWIEVGVLRFALTHACSHTFVKIRSRNSSTVTFPHITACAQRVSPRPAAPNYSLLSRTARSSYEAGRMRRASSCTSSRSSLLRAIRMCTVRRAVEARSSRWRCSPWASRTTSRLRIR